MLSCKDVSRLLSQHEDRKLRFGEQIALRLHLAICDVCRDISRQMKFLRPAVQRLSVTATTGNPEPRCAGCGAAFICGMQAGEKHCWCSDLPPLEPIPGRGCLCRRCLVDELSEDPRQRSR